jgi:hypothetical protein
MNKKSERIRYLIAVFACIFVLSGCSTSVMQAGNIFEGKHVNLTEVSYAAADMLVQQTKAYVTSDTILQIGMLTDMQEPDVPTAFGRIVAGHIGARFVQLGYNVTAASFQSSAGMPMEAAVSNDSAYAAPQQGYISRKGAGHALITGNYAVARKDVLVNLRIIESASGRVLAAYDYNLPLSGDIKELMKTGTEDEGSSFFGPL